jgi:hypothetical protein
MIFNDCYLLNIALRNTSELKPEALVSRIKKLSNRYDFRGRKVGFSLVLFNFVKK